MLACWQDRKNQLKNIADIASTESALIGVFGRYWHLNPIAAPIKMTMLTGALVL